jgi:lysophospholipase L1-like esterase
LNLTLSISIPSATGAPLPGFPATVVPSVWLDGNQQAFSDSAGTLPVSSGIIRRVNEPAAQGGFWASTSDAERPLRDNNGVRLELFNAAGGCEMTRPNVGGIPQNACTVVVSMMLRDNSFAGPPMGVFRDDAVTIGLWIAGSAIFIFSAAFTWNPSTLALVPGVQNTVVIEYLSTGMVCTLRVNGVTTTESFSQTNPSTPVPGVFRVGLNGSGYFYGSLSQAFVVPRTVTSTEKAALLAWAEAQPIAAAYPLDRALVAASGDSITRGTQAVYGSVYLPLALTNLRATKPLVEMANCAIGGTGVTNILRAGSTLTRAMAFYNPTRAKNILVVFLGTNDLANSNGVAYTLYGTGAPDGAGVYAACDAARAQGWKVILCTMLPRSDNPGFQATFNAQRATFNTDVRANWTLHADALCDFAAVSGMGADGDSNNTTNYSTDKIHPVNAGHALLEPTFRAALLPFL